jgi:hypothetical protein
MRRAAPGAMVGATSLSESPATDFTPSERAYIRRELDLFFSTAWFRKCHSQVTPEIDRALMVKGFLVLGVTLI